MHRRAQFQGRRGRHRPPRVIPLSGGGTRRHRLVPGPTGTVGAKVSRECDCPPGKGGAGLSEGGQRELVALMTRVAAGDRAAFRSLYERTSAKLFSSIRRILINQAAAEDAVQDAYVRIWRRAGD